MSDNQVHSRIGASSMYRWAACPGSVKLSENVVSVSSVHAEEGTRAHEVAAHYLTTKSWDKSASPEMIEAVKVYTDIIEEDASKSVHKDFWNLVEHKFDLSSLFPGLFGTSDNVMWTPKEKLLRVYDYKHGAGLPVEVKDNSQLKYYALGALLTTKARAKDVELVIVQPRCYHPDGPVRRVRISAMELIDFAADLVEAATKTQEENAPLNPGEHCRFCPASGFCPAIHSKALAAAKLEFTPTLSYDPVKLSETLSMLDTIEGWAKSVRDFAYREAQQGRIPPGWKLVDKRANRSWKEDVTAKSLSAYLCIDEIDLQTEPKLKSPAQVEKLIGKSKELKQKLSTLVVQESSGTVLVEETDDRPSALNSAKKDFDIIEMTNNQ